MPSETPGHDVEQDWCDWCDDEDVEITHVVSLDRFSFDAYFCSRECAESWGCAADQEKIEPVGERLITDGGDRSPISDVSCPACGSEIFELKAVDEWANGDLSIYCYCAECGNATGKMWDRTVDNRITDTDRRGEVDHAE